MKSVIELQFGAFVCGRGGLLGEMEAEHDHR